MRSHNSKFTKPRSSLIVSPPSLLVSDLFCEDSLNPYVAPDEERSIKEEKKSRQNWTLRSGTTLQIPTRRYVNYFVIFLWFSTKTRPRLFVNFHKKITNSQKIHKLPTYLRKKWMWIHKFVSAEISFGRGATNMTTQSIIFDFDHP